MDNEKVEIEIVPRSTHCQFSVIENHLNVVTKNQKILFDEIKRPKLSSDAAMKAAKKIWADLKAREGLEEVMAEIAETGLKNEILREWAKIIEDTK